MTSPLLLRSVTRSLGSLTFASARSNTTSSAGTILSRSTTSAQVFAHTRRNFIAEASSQTSQDATPEKKTSRAKSTTTKAKTAKKPAVKKAKKPKKEPKKKLKSWEKVGADGKLLPLPSASKPKRKSAYIIFITERVPNLRSDPSFLTTGKDGEQKFEAAKAIKRLSEEWKSLSEGERASFNAKAEAGAEKYERDLERWRNALTPEDIKRENAYITSQRKKGKSGVAKLRDPTKPKAPITPFFQFFQELRNTRSSEIAGLSIPEAAKKVGAEWKQLSADEKEPFTKRYAEEREKYNADLKEWESSSGLG